MSMIRDYLVQTTNAAREEKASKQYEELHQEQILMDKEVEQWKIAIKKEMAGFAHPQHRLSLAACRGDWELTFDSKVKTSSKEWNTCSRAAHELSQETTYKGLDFQCNEKNDQMTVSWPRGTVY